MQHASVMIVGADGNEIGVIIVTGDDEAEPIQLAATAAESLKHGRFKVGEESFTWDEAQEWFA